MCSKPCRFAHFFALKPNGRAEQRCRDKADDDNEREKQTLADISRQIELASTSNKTPQGVKDCIETIIFEASNEASLPLSDFSLVRAAFPNIIENLNKDYGRGIYHMLHAILQYNTDAFQKF
jgi:hypothetical protein